MSQDVLELACPAKVNLALSVGSPRADGFHPIASWMACVNFADHLTLRRTDGPSRFDIRFAADEPAVRNAKVDWPLEKDLAYRAHQAVERHVGRPLPVDATLMKRIPAGAGLGGGSSDAAAMLVGLNRLFALSLDGATLATLARQLGSDVVFLVRAILGEPAAIVTGVGEGWSAAAPAEFVPLVLIFPPFGCPTGEVYRAFDQQLAGRGQQADEPRVRALASAAPVPQDGPFNNLAEPAMTVRPKLRELRDVLQREMGLPVYVTGSGSTLFVIAPSVLTSKTLASKITAASGLPAVEARTL